MSRLLPLLLLLSLSSLSGQNAPSPTTAEARLGSFEQRQALREASIANAIPFRSLGPSVFSGRAVDMDVWAEDPTHFYVAYASGGLWKTENNGISFTPLFDKEAVMTLGDIAVDWERNIIWAGTGEVNSSRSSYAGAGVYKSMDGGQSWQHLGLAETHHIGRILLDPQDPNTAWVAAMGHLYSSNEERGIYKTTDGGQSWQRTLYAGPEAGAVDLIADPADPKSLYAAIWQRERRAWDLIESGAASAIYKSTDGGDTWARITKTGNGFPTGEGTGRIGLAAALRDGQTVLYASIDNNHRRPKEDSPADELSKDALRDMSTANFLALPIYKVEDYLRSNGFPKKYKAQSVREQVERGEISTADLVAYTEDANALLFDTPVTGLEVYRSDNGGRTWEKTHEGYLDDVYYSYGYYFGEVRVAPQNPDKLYVMGVPILRSDDGGKTWSNINGDNVHVDHHALWVSPERDGHLILGNDGGINISYDDGKHWNKCNSPAVGQFYTVAVDHAKPYRVYGGTQDNGVWMGPSTYKASDRWQASGRYPYRSIMGGDGMQVAIDTRSNDIVYTGYQFGNYFRINTDTEERTYITPKPELGQRAYRWNWQAPIHLSVHNQDILYMGANKLLRSLNRGDDFEEISGDLTQGGRKGDVPYGTLSSIHESPLQFGLLYTGSDDGKVHRSKDGGHTWTDIGQGLPGELWVSRVQASAHEKARVYLALNGYRWDDFTPYLYVSEDYGQNWQAIGKDLPLEPINVIKEDPENAALLYVGTDHGLYVSLDRGNSFMLLDNGLPAVAVHDLAVQPQARELVVGTHGRSLYAGSVKELQQLDSAMLAKPLHAFEPSVVNYRSSWGRKSVWPQDPPSASLLVYCREAGMLSISLQSAAGLELASFKQAVVKGLNFVNYDLKISKKILSEYNKELNKEQKPEEKPIKVEVADDGGAYLYKGKYKVKMMLGKAAAESTLVVE